LQIFDTAISFGDTQLTVYEIWHAPTLLTAECCHSSKLFEGILMPQTQFVFFNKAQLSSLSMLQESLDQHNFKLELNPRCDLFKHQGFLPCVLRGDTGMGFDVFYESSKLFLQENPDSQIRNLVGDKDSLISLSWGESFKDCVCVMMVCAALAIDFEATISYECGGIESVESILAGIDFCFKQIAEGQQ
jgi:hypothetical protein